MAKGFYRASKDETIYLNGVVAWTDTANVDYDVRLVAMEGNTTRVNVLIDSFSAVSVGTVRMVVLSHTIKVKAGYEVAIVLLSQDKSENIEIVFSKDTYLTISTKETDTDVPDSTTLGISYKDALKALGERIGVYVEGFMPDTDILTNGNNIRNIASPINLSFAYIFEQLRILYDVEADLIGDTIHIKRAEDAKPKNSMYLGELKSDIVLTPNLDKLYSAISAGYNTWQGDSKLKGAEYNSVRNYETRLNYGSRTRNFMLNLIASGYVIEEQRRLQFDTEKKIDGSKYDESIFLIDLEDGDYNPRGNIMEAGGVLNLKYTPASIIENNKRELKYQGKIRLVSTEGNSVAIVSGKREDRDFDFGNIMPFTAGCVVEIDPRSFNDMKYIQAGDYYIKVTDAEMKLNDRGKGLVNVTGECLNLKNI